MDEKTGRVLVEERIDRDSLCPGADLCVLSFDVAVLPIQHFLTIKVGRRKFSTAYFIDVPVYYWFSNTFGWRPENISQNFEPGQYFSEEKLTTLFFLALRVVH